MTQVHYAPRAREDLLRLADFLSKEDPGSAEETAALIINAIQILERHPLIGRRVSDSTMRELAISRGRTGYVALYEYHPSMDAVVVSAIRHQREAGFED